MEKHRQTSESEASEAAQQCKICSDIRLVLTETGRHVDLGPLDTLKEKSCPGHDALITFVEGKRQESFFEGPLRVEVRSEDGAGGKIWLIESEYRRSGWPLLVANPTADIPMAGYGRTLDSDWVDVKLLQNWTHECLEKHGDRCDNPFKVAHTHPAWLIDTVDNCLVPGIGIYDFVALSYRWGSSPYFQTELGILDVLQKPGALLLPEFSDRVSPMVKQATKLVSILGERYLWADALCVVQNHAEQTTQQLLLMGAIYAAAKLTIVITDGDASHGIPGIEGVSQSRKLRQSIIPFGKGEKIISRNIPSLCSMGESLMPGYFDRTPGYFDRAWTFQEYYLSKRRLIVGNNQFHWKCSAATFHEDAQGPDYDSHRDFTNFRLPHILSGEPDFKELNSLLNEYNRRQLTFPEDALAGATGLITILSRSFPSGFIYGLPEARFESALMWNEYVSQYGMERRVHSGKIYSILQNSQLPSWSWLGWKTILMIASDEHSGELFSGGPITTCITQWYSHEAPFSTTKRPINSSLLHHESDGGASEPVVPWSQGWSKEEFDAQKHFQTSSLNTGASFNVLGKFVYRHERLPGRLFWRPRPLVDVSQCSDADAPPQHAFISCKTKRGWFQAKRKPRGERLRPGVDITEDGNLVVYDKSHTLCGYLKHPFQAFPAVFSREAMSEVLTVELVAICRRKRVEPWTADQPGGVIWNPQFKHQYGVLWIEWIEGVAYRKSCGHIDKESWESQDLEDVDLVLG